MNTKNIRMKYFSFFVLTFIIELFIGVFVHDDFIRPYVGDIIVVVCLYSALRAVFPTKFKNLSLYVLIFAIVIELLQLVNINQILGFEDNRLLNIVLGSVFDIKDIICYVIGYVLIIIFEMKFKSKL